MRIRPNFPPTPPPTSGDVDQDTSGQRREPRKGGAEISRPQAGATIVELESGESVTARGDGRLLVDLPGQVHVDLGGVRDGELQDSTVAVGDTTLSLRRARLEPIPRGSEGTVGGRVLTEGLRLATGDTTFRSNAAAVELGRHGDGSVVLAVDGQNMEVETGDQAFRADGRADASVVLAPSGEIVRAAFESHDGVEYEGGGRRIRTGGHGSVVATRDEQGGLHGRIEAKEVELADPGMRIGVQDGVAEASRTESGDLVRISGSRFRFEGRAADNHDTTVEIGSFSARSLRTHDGTELISIDRARDIRVSVDGVDVAIDAAQVDMVREDGELAALTFALDGAASFEQTDGALAIRTTNAAGRATVIGDEVSVQFASEAVYFTNGEQTAEIHGFAANGTSKDMRLHVDSAELRQQVGAHFPDLKIERIDVHAVRDGDSEAYDVAFGALTGRLEDVAITARTEGDKQIRLYASAEDGKVTDAGLIMPDGSEVIVRSDDGSAHFRGELALHGSDDGVVLDHLHGQATFETKGARVTLDAEQVDGFVFGVIGPDAEYAQGAGIVARPTTDGSTMTAQIRTKVGGIDLGLGVADVHDLELLGQMRTNEVRLRAADNSGRGTVTARFGPLKLQSERKAGYGSAIDLAIRYNGFDARRVLDAIGGFTAAGGLPVDVNVTDKGWFRLHTNERQGGLGAALAVKPVYGTDDLRSALSAVATVGGRFEMKEGGTQGIGVYAGAVDASSVTWDLKQGEAKLGGLELPDRFSLPATVVGGLKWDRVRDGTQVAATVGAFGNVVGALQAEGVIDEPVKAGVTASLQVDDSTDRYRWGVQAFKSLDDSQTWGVELNVSFQF